MLNTHSLHLAIESMKMYTSDPGKTSKRQYLLVQIRLKAVNQQDVGVNRLCMVKKNQAYVKEEEQEEQ